MWLNRILTVNKSISIYGIYGLIEYLLQIKEEAYMA